MPEATLGADVGIIYFIKLQKGLAMWCIVVYNKAYQITRAVTDHHNEREDRMKRRKVTIDEVRANSYLPEAENLGICALVDVENMGWCKDSKTRWYMFDLDGEPCIYFKY